MTRWQIIHFVFIDVFKFDPEFAKNEAIYEEIRQEIIGDAGSSSDEEGDDDAGDEDADEAGAAGACFREGIAVIDLDCRRRVPANRRQHGTESGRVSSHRVLDDSILARLSRSGA